MDTRKRIALAGLMSGISLLVVACNSSTSSSEMENGLDPFVPLVQKPFVCSVADEFGIEPRVDSAEPPGFAVMGEDGETVVGYSRDCHIDPFTTYFYRTQDSAWEEWPDEGAPDDLAMTTTIDGDEVEFVVRVERGVINRFIYSYAMLVNPELIPEDAENPDLSRWNGRLAYHFQGGVGIGHTQGRWADSRAMKPEILGLGHAIAYSTGTRAGEHYNLQVGGQTAVMTKDGFVARYGDPDYTVGVGCSGGGVQQYVYGQNHPDLIDAAIPDCSYPDMVTQTIHISDCELLEHYMDTTDVMPEFWEETENRSLLVGLNAEHIPGAIEDPFFEAKQAQGFNAAPGMTECVPAWRGLTPLTLNPLFGEVRNAERWEPQSDIAEIEWTHMDDLRNIYGEGDDGFARIAVDNVGVQYGLRAFVRGDITTEQFLHVNENVGSWKDPAEMVQEGYPFIGDPTPENFDPWSRRNMRLSEDDAPAPRREGNLDAIRALYETGMIFQGEMDIPTIDVREYLEPVLDMHNAHQSFAARQRILDAKGAAEQHVIWFGDMRSNDPADPLPGMQFDIVKRALLSMDEWMLDERPEAAVDSCFDFEGGLIAAGDDVWNGILDEATEGACAQTFPLYTQSRIEAGGPISGDVFKCQLKSVDQALSDGTYGERSFTEGEEARLRATFPDGVCDYSQPDLGRPG